MIPSINANRPAKSNAAGNRPTPGSWIKVGVAWALVSLPLAWGVFKTFEKAAVLFRS